MKTVAWKIAMFWMVLTEERIRHAKFKTSDMETKWRVVVKAYIRAANMRGYTQDAEVLMELLEQQDMTNDYLGITNSPEDLKILEDEEVEAIMTSISSKEALKGRFYRLLGWDKPISEKSVGIPGW